VGGADGCEVVIAREAVPVIQQSLFWDAEPVEGLDETIASQVADSLQRPAGKLAPPLTYPADFPVHDFVVNMGLTLREA